MKKKEKCVIVLSGGPDSVTVAYWAKKEGYRIYPITFKYGQIASREVKAAQKIAKMLGTSTKVVNLSSLKHVFGKVTSLCSDNIPMTDSFSPPIIVPFRNAIFLSVAVSYAASISASKIFYGAHHSDEPNYPDCRNKFYKAFEKAACLGTDSPISIDAPYIDRAKSEVLRAGKEMRVPFELTWSCYRNNLKQCGKCESCVNRKKAFEAAEILDPTEYEA